MSDLLEALADVWTDAPEWEPIYAPRGEVDKLCRDCGARTPYNRGGCGPDLPGSFTVCDECAKLDGARVRSCTPVAERRPAHVGHEMWECAHCACGWWSFDEYWHDDGEWRAFTADEIADMLATHAIPRYVSRWGVAPYPIAEHEELVRAQAKRRRAYLAHRSTDLDHNEQERR